MVLSGMIISWISLAVGVQHKPPDASMTVRLKLYIGRLGRIPTAQRSSRTRIHVVEAREALHVLRQPVCTPVRIQPVFSASPTGTRPQG